MLIFKYIIYGIVIGFINPPIFDYQKHIFILNEIFNTTIFNDRIFPIFSNIGVVLAFLIYLSNDIFLIIKNNYLYIKSKKKEKLKYKKIFNYSIYFLISLIPITYFSNSMKNILISLLISALSLIIFTFKKGTKSIKDITIKNIIFISLIQILINIFNISDLSVILLTCILCNIKKDISLKISLLYYSFISLFSFTLTSFNTFESYLYLPYIIGTIITSLTTYYSILRIHSLNKKNKLWRLSIYFIILSLFILFWFR